jgi:hypothetical protein
MTREEAIETLKANYPDACFGQLRDAVDTAISALKQPEIIHCKKCKHWLDIDDGRQKHRMCADIYGDWFCADAERRADD